MDEYGGDDGGSSGSGGSVGAGGATTEVATRWSAHNAFIASRYSPSVILSWFSSITRINVAKNGLTVIVNRLGNQEPV